MIAKLTPWSRAILTDAQKAIIAAAQPGRATLALYGHGPSSSMSRERWW